MTRKRMVDEERGWTWEILDYEGRWVLCWYMYHTKKELLDDHKPSPEARPVRVIMRRWEP